MTTQQQTIPCNDRIFLGEGLFETLRFVDKRPCYLQEHWDRLAKGALFLGITLPCTFKECSARLGVMLENQSLHQGGVKIILTGGAAPRGLIRQGVNPQLVFDIFSYEKNRKPLRLISAPWLRDSNNPIYQIKSVNYLEAILAQRYAQQHEADDVLFFNTQQDALETSVANFFVLVDEVMYTPALEEGVLPGVTRQRIINFCHEQGIVLREGIVNRVSLTAASFMFVCNALQGIQVVEAWDEVIYSGLNVHPSLQRLISHLLDD